MAHDAKIGVITDFVIGIERLKIAAKEDAKTLLKACPLDILGDPVALEAYLTEMLETIVTKHVITPDRKVRPEVAKLIKAYAKGLSA